VVERDESHPDPTPELRKLVDLAAKYPEIGPPLAELAFKIGQEELGNRVVRMGLEKEGPGVEFYFVAANAARREGKHDEALQKTLDAVRAYSSTADAALAPDDGPRLLHLIRQGFTSLMFDLKDVQGQPEFVTGLKEELPRLSPRLGNDPFYRALLAQTIWYEDKQKSEDEWECAVELGEAEHTWNARGTWYKEAERDTLKAEKTYRQGLDVAPHSALLLHNLAQLLLERAAQPDVSGDDTRKLLREGDELLRRALREDSPKGFRRYIHTTRDRLNELRSTLPPRAPEEPPPPEREPEVGEVVKGRVLSLTQYGAFVSIGAGAVGLLHKSEMAHEMVADPARLVKVGDEVEVKVLEVRRENGKLRIGLSRKALLPAPAGRPAPQPQQDRRPPRPANRDRNDRRDTRDDRSDRRDDRRDRPPPREREPNDGFPRDDKLAKLGEMILAKLKEQSKG
jgi:predicted RNA-binding protein with RPS1 domain